MATWQELLVPTIGTLGGVTITALVQMINTHTQRNHDRRTKLLDEKRRAYSEFVNIVKRTAEAKKLLVQRQGQIELTLQQLEQIAAKAPVAEDGTFDSETKNLLNQEKEEVEAVIQKMAGEIDTYKETMDNLKKKPCRIGNSN